jgi:hypothetical protein
MANLEAAHAFTQASKVLGLEVIPRISHPLVRRHTATLARDCINARKLIEKLADTLPPDQVNATVRELAEELIGVLRRHESYSVPHSYYNRALKDSFDRVAAPLTEAAQ